MRGIGEDSADAFGIGLALCLGGDMDGANPAKSTASGQTGHPGCALGGPPAADLPPPTPPLPTTLPNRNPDAGHSPHAPARGGTRADARVSRGQPPPAPPIQNPDGTRRDGTAGPRRTQEQLYKIVVNTNQVVIPVRVTDESGQMINDLPPRGFYRLQGWQEAKAELLHQLSVCPVGGCHYRPGHAGRDGAESEQDLRRPWKALSAYDEVALYTYSTSWGEPRISTA